MSSAWTDLVSRSTTGEVKGRRKASVSVEFRTGYMHFQKTHVAREQEVLDVLIQQSLLNKFDRGLRSADALAEREGEARREGR